MKNRVISVDVPDDVTSVYGAAQANFKAKANTTNRVTNEVTSSSHDLVRQQSRSINQTKSEQEERAQVTGKNPDTPFEMLNTYEGWNENALGDIQQPTYSIRLFITDDRPYDFKKFPSYDDLVRHITHTKKQSTIAQSGVTGLNITGLTINSTVAPTPNGRTMNPTNITLNLVEPGGVSLMDILAEASKELKVKNYYKTQFYLEIKFLGYNGDDSQGLIGDFNINPCASFPNQGIWIYQMFLVDIDSEISASGGSYKMTFKPFEENIMVDDDLHLPSQIAPEGSTVKEMVDSLMDQLNEHVELMYGTQLRKYKVELRPFEFNGQSYDPNDANRFKLTPGDPNYADKRAVTMLSTGGRFKAIFPHGTRVNDAIEQIFANCEQVQKLAKDVNIEGVLDMEHKNRLRECLVMRCYPVAQPGDYDFMTDQYMIEYTMVIMPYFTELPILTHEQVEITKNPQVQADNVMKLRKNGYLAKRYDYIFTGMNTEVIHFDIKHNAKWSAVLPRALGNINSMESQASFDLQSKTDLLKHQEEVRRFGVEENKLKRLNLDVEQVRSELDSGVLSEAQKAQRTSQLNELLSKLSSFNESDSTRERKAQALSKARDQLRTGRTALNSRLKARSGDVDESRDSNRYAEELLGADRSPAWEQYSPMPLSISQSSEDSRFYASGAFPDSHHRDRAILGAVMDQLYETTGAALQNINLEIRGDPYWLGYGNLHRNWINLHQITKPVNLSAPPVDFTLPDYTRGDILFLLTYRYPRGITEDGSVEIRYNDFFTGIYMAVTVTHKFEGGQFTQTLNAKRMPTIEVFRAFGLRTDDEYKKIEADKTAKRMNADVEGKFDMRGGTPVVKDKR